jgi:hypothetical protein
MFANHRKEDGLYPLTIIEIAKHKKRSNLRSIVNRRKIPRSIQKRSKNIKSGFAFSTY